MEDKPRTGKRKAVRLQVPVSPKVARDLEAIALELDRSVSKLGQRFIEWMVEDDKVLFGNWLFRRVQGPGTELRKFGWRQTAEGETVRLQITIWEDTSKKLEAISNRLNHSPVRCAALVLDFGLDVYVDDMRFWNTWPMSKLRDWLLGKPKPDPESDASEVRVIEF